MCVVLHLLEAMWVKCNFVKVKVSNFGEECIVNVKAGYSWIDS